MLAEEHGEALGYEAKVLSGLIGREWVEELVRGHDYDVLDGEDLREFKALYEVVGKNPTTFKFSRSAIVVYESGFDRINMLTKKPAGKELRGVVVRHVLPRLRRGEAVSLASTAGHSVATDELRVELADVRAQLAALTSALAAVAAHPERFASYDDLRDNLLKQRELKGRIRLVATEGPHPEGDS